MARKGKDSILNGIQRIQDYELIVHPRCVNGAYVSYLRTNGRRIALRNTQGNLKDRNITMLWMLYGMVWKILM